MLERIMGSALRSMRCVLDMVVYVRNPRTRVTETGELAIQGQADYRVGLCLNKKKYWRGQKSHGGVMVWA